MLQKLLKPFKQKSFWAIYSAMAMLAIMAISASADSTPSMIPTETIVTAVSTAVTDTLALMAALLPVALSVFATIWGVRKAMRFFKSASN